MYFLQSATPMCPNVEELCRDVVQLTAVVRLVSGCFHVNSAKTFTSCEEIEVERTFRKCDSCSLVSLVGQSHLHVTLRSFCCKMVLCISNFRCLMTFLFCKNNNIMSRDKAVSDGFQYNTGSCFGPVCQ